MQRYTNIYTDNEQKRPPNNYTNKRSFKNYLFVHYEVMYPLDIVMITTNNMWLNMITGNTNCANMELVTYFVKFGCFCFVGIYVYYIVAE